LLYMELDLVMWYVHIDIFIDLCLTRRSSTVSGLFGECVVHFGDRLVGSCLGGGDGGCDGSLERGNLCFNLCVYLRIH